MVLNQLYGNLQKSCPHLLKCNLLRSKRKYLDDSMIRWKYLDNSLLIGETVVICLNNVIDAFNLLRILGFTIHSGKSIFLPNQKITFVGFIIDSVRMTITLIKEAKGFFFDNSSSLLQSNKRITVRELAQTIGTLVAAFRAAS